MEDVPACEKCKGTGRIAETRESNAERVRCSAWVAELEAELTTLYALRREARRSGRLRESCDLSCDIDTLELRIAAERRRSATSEFNERRSG